ncbi:MAG: hypothetical protein L0219_21770, partial [Phycisphaerales bacterium]|nr:hypothetical protein [Phycisphaerales bacterium]
EKARMTIAGKPVLVPVPIELPEGMEWAGVFGVEGGEWCGPQEKLVERVRVEGVPAALKAVRQLQMEGKYREALGVIDGVLAVDALNPAGLALRDVIQTAQLYRDYTETQRQKEAGFSAVPLANQRAMVLPRPNVAGPTNGSASGTKDSSVAFQGFVEIPQTNWPDDENMTRGGTIAFPWQRGRPRDDTAPSQTPVLGELPLVRIYGSPSEVDNSVGMVQNHFELIDELADFDPSSFAGMTVVGEGGQVGLAGRQLQRDSSGRITLYNAQFNNAPQLDLDAALAFGKVEAVPGAGSGSGYGGGGGGGSIVGEAGEDPARYSRAAEPLSEEEKRQQVVDVVEATVQPEAWDDQGGDLATVSHEYGVFRFKALKDSPEAHAVVDEARAFLQYLHQRIQESKTAGAIDSPPIQPFSRSTTVVIYDVRDLIGGIIKYHGGDPATGFNDFVVNDLIDVLTENIDVETWRMNGGERGDIWHLEGHLIIDHTPERHAAIEKFLTEVRAVLLPREAQTKEVAATPEEAKAASPEVAPIDQRVLTIYDVRDLVEVALRGVQPGAAPRARDEVMQQIIDIICDNVDPEGWQMNGGDTSGLQALAGTLIITTTPANHEAIVELLKQMREMVGVAPEAESRKTEPAPPVQIDPKQLEEQITMAKRVARLRRVLDQRLWGCVTIEGSASEPSQNSALTPTLSQREREKEVAIAVLVGDASDGTVAELKSVGMRAEDVAEAIKVVAGFVAPDRLDDVALLECVRRIEPIQVN